MRLPEEALLADIGFDLHPLPATTTYEYVLDIGQDLLNVDTRQRIANMSDAIGRWVGYEQATPGEDYKTFKGKGKARFGENLTINNAVSEAVNKKQRLQSPQKSPRRLSQALPMCFSWMWCSCQENAKSFAYRAW